MIENIAYHIVAFAVGFLVGMPVATIVEKYVSRRATLKKGTPEH